ERLKIIRDLRLGKYDAVVGINLLREGIDIPEVSLIAIMDADKQGFLRSARSLIQTIGRCARNSNGHVIMYADKISPAMEEAISETERRRKIQAEYNKVNGITPTTIVKAIKEIVSNDIANKNPEKMKKRDRQKLIVQIEEEMNEAARAMDFERAMELRDVLFELKGI
ncbi:MAG: UvrB/UvrC motif-containing protein, partial [Bacilli bacterium]